MPALESVSYNRLLTSKTEIETRRIYLGEVI